MCFVLINSIVFNLYLFGLHFGQHFLVCPKVLYLGDIHPPSKKKKEEKKKEEETKQKTKKKKRSSDSV